MIKWKLVTINSNETVNVTHAENKEEAEYIFAKIKNMPLKVFRNLFKVEEYGEARRI